MISVQCPSCKKVHSSPDSVLGRKVRCNDCQHVFVVTHDAGLLEVTPTTNLPHQVQQKPVEVHSSRKTIRYKCPKCKSKLESGAHLSGKSDVCPVCKTPVPVPVLTKLKWMWPVAIVAGVVVIGAMAFFILSYGSNALKLPVLASPLKQMVQNTLLATLPPYLSLESIELESIPTGPESAKVNFKAIVTPKEDLYEVDRELEGTPTIILIKVVQPAGAKASFYGFFEASRTMDQWTLGSPQIGVGLQQFGSPRASFPPHSYITGSDDADAAVKEQAAKAAEQERVKKEREKEDARKQKEREEKEARERKERQEREEQARIEREKERREKEALQKKEEEEARQKLIDATAAHTYYIGTISHEDERQRLLLTFTEQNGILIRAEARNPDRGEKQTFIGELIFNPEPEEGNPNVAYPVVLSPIGEQKFKNDEVWRFYSRKGSLKLYLTDIGLEGEAYMEGSFSNAPYIVRLQRGDIKVPREESVKIPPVRDKKERSRRRAY